VVADQTLAFEVEDVLAAHRVFLRHKTKALL
jgi:hypothetical protein